MKPVVPVFLSLGSNISPAQNIRAAVRLLSERVPILAISSVWETTPVGSSGPNFYNAAVSTTTDLSLDELKTKLRGIEHGLGRIRTADKYAARTIDIDPVIYADKLVEPRLWVLSFLAVPLAEIYPSFIQPETGRTLAEIAREMELADHPRRRPDVLAQNFP